MLKQKRKPDLLFLAIWCIIVLARNFPRRVAMQAVKEKAYAKINLYLDCLAKREDGFHDIKTVMHSLSLCDEVTVTLLSRDRSGIRMQLDGNRRLPTDGRNLVYAAAKLFMERAAISADISIRLDKRIPISAGLAGGSSDAAATLRALNRLFGKCFTDKTLLSIAAELGSDVPYCLVGGTALCLGRGERITRLDTPAPLYTVIAIDNEHVSTPMAYAALDERYSDFDGTVITDAEDRYAELISYLDGGEFPPSGLYNIFEGAILPECPGAAAIKKKLISLGAVCSVMSGSGPSVFGIFESADAARAAENALRAEGIRAYYAVSV